MAHKVRLYLTVTNVPAEAIKDPLKKRRERQKRETEKERGGEVERWKKEKREGK